MISFLKIITILFGISSFRVKSAPIIYGFSSGILPNDTQEFVFRGFLMSLKSFKDINVDKDLRLIYSNSASLTSPIDVAREVLKENPQVITGFPSSFESQLAAPILKESGILTIFASSSNLSLANMASNLYSSSESILISNLKISEMIQSKYKNKMGIVIYNPFDYFSINQKMSWEKILKENKALNLKFIATTLDGKISSNQLAECMPAKFVITSLFPLKSYDLFRIFDEKSIDLPVYSNSSWYKMEISSLKRFILKKKAPVYLVQFKGLNPSRVKKISNDYIKKYNSNPSPEVLIGYDLGVIVGSILKRSKDLNKSPIEIMKNKPCFEGSPFGRVCFGGNGGFAPRQITLVDINESK
jgi:hypothetical protein